MGRSTQNSGSSGFLKIPEDLVTGLVILLGKSWWTQSSSHPLWMGRTVLRPPLSISLNSQTCLGSVVSWTCNLGIVYLFFLSFVIVSCAHTYWVLKAKLFKIFRAHLLYHTDEVILSLLVFSFPYITCKMK